MLSLDVNEPLDDKTGENQYFRHYEPLVALSPDSEEKHLVPGTNIKQEESDDETQDAKVEITNTFGIARERIKFYFIKLSFL